MNRDVFFLEDLLKAQMAQPHHQGYQVVTYISKILPSGSQEDGGLLADFPPGHPVQEDGTEPFAQMGGAPQHGL